MGYETLRLEHDGGIATLTLDRPKSLNALNRQALGELNAAIHSLFERRDVRALILTGAGEKAFVAGADIAEMAALSAEEGRAFAELGHRVMSLLEALPFPVIAAVNGYALGGGCELALACDFICASEKAKLGLPEVGLGLIPGFGGTQRLTRLVGRARAKELIFTGRQIGAAEAKEIGLVLDVVAPDALLTHCRKIAEQIATKGPLAVAQAKRAIDEGADADLRVGNAIERGGFATLFASEDRLEGMKAFMEKRAPAFTGK